MKTYACPTRFGFKGEWRGKIKNGRVRFDNYYINPNGLERGFCDCVSSANSPVMVAYATCINCAGRGVPAIPWRDLNE